MEEQPLKTSAATVQEATEKGLKQLGLSEEQVSIEVVDEGSPGFLGIGGRDAVVAITVLDADDVAPAAEVSMNTAVPESDTAAGAADEKDDSSTIPADDEQQRDEEIALEIIDQLLTKMDVEAATSLKQTVPDDLTGEQRWVVDINGDDLGLLIGSRGDTLNALQYVARLMTGHVTHRRSGFLVDVEGYRERREQALARLAERMASKAMKRGTVVTLEPMPPNERRIIHITLRKDDRVYTESIEEGQRRRVRIIPQSEAERD